MGEHRPRAENWLVIIGLREPPGRPPPWRPQPGRPAFDLGVPLPRHATPFGTHAEARGAREGSPVWAGADLALNMFLAVTGFAQAAPGGVVWAAFAIG